MLYVQPLLMVVFRLEAGGPAAWNANASPLNEFPVNACAAQVLTPQETGRVALTLKDQLHAVGLQPAFITLGMFATQIEFCGTGTDTPELFGAVAGH